MKNILNNPKNTQNCLKLKKVIQTNKKESEQEALKFNEEFPQDLLFFKESTKEYILMSDDQEVHIFYTSKDSNKARPTIVFIQGVGPGIFSWTDLWDQLYKEFNLVVIDSREKPTINLKKNIECKVTRIALDIAEVIHHLKIKEEDTVIIASSFGIYYVAHCVAEKWVEPRGCVLIGPAIESSYPKLKTRFAFMLPTVFLEKIGKKIAHRFLAGKVADGFQRKVYYERIDSIDVERWKRCSKMRFWNAAEDYKKIECPIMIYSPIDDKYHTKTGAEEVNKLLRNSNLETVPSYNYMHIKPGVIDFANKIKKKVLEF